MRRRRRNPLTAAETRELMSAYKRVSKASGQSAGMYHAAAVYGDWDTVKKMANPRGRRRRRNPHPRGRFRSPAGVVRLSRWFKGRSVGPKRPKQKKRRVVGRWMAWKHPRARSSVPGYPRKYTLTGYLKTRKRKNGRRRAKRSRR